MASRTLQTTFKAIDLFGGWGSDWSCAATAKECLEKRRQCSYINAMDCGAGPAVGELPADGMFRLLYASMHQHVSVISGSLYNADTGELVCKTEPIYGSSDVAHDEEGYAVGIRPCIWDAGGVRACPFSTKRDNKLQCSAGHCSVQCPPPPFIYISPSLLSPAYQHSVRVGLVIMLTRTCTHTHTHILDANCTTPKGFFVATRSRDES